MVEGSSNAGQSVLQVSFLRASYGAREDVRP